MKIKNQQLIDDVLDYFKNIIPEDIVAIIHHTDPDGITSGVLAAKLVERLRNKKADIRYNQKGNEVAILKETVDYLKKKGANKIIITDLNCDSNPETLRLLSEFASVIVLDHHPVTSTQHAIIYKPPLAYDLEESAGYCSAKIVYDIATQLVNMKDLDWICGIGMIGDIATEKFKSFMNDVCHHWNIEKKDDWFETTLGKCAVIISSTENFDEENVPEAYNELYKASGPEDILNSPIAKYEEIINKEINKLIDAYHTTANQQGKVVFYEITPKFGVKGTVASLLSKQHPDKLLIVADMRGTHVHISARTQDAKIEANTILTNAAKGKGNAGGHRMAAGGTIEKSKWQEFKQAVMAQQ